MKKLLFAVLLFCMPAVVFAQKFGDTAGFSSGGGNLGPLRQLVRSVGDILNALIPILIVIALLAFFWGLIQYIRHPEFKTGKSIMIAGILALFIMVSVWGIVRLVQTSLGVTDNSAIQPPAVPQYQL